MPFKSTRNENVQVTGFGSYVKNVPSCEHCYFSVVPGTLHQPTLPEPYLLRIISMIVLTIIDNNIPNTSIEHIP